jgi:hypothetical protein
VTTCGPAGPSTTTLVGALQHAGLGHDLAVCIARAAERKLDRQGRDALARDPSNLTPPIAEQVTKLAATCAVATAQVPTTASRVPPSTP